MNKIIAFILAILLITPTFADQPTDPIINACQSLKRQTDRNKCLEEAVKLLTMVKQAPAPASPPVPVGPSKKEVASKRAEPVIASAMALQSVIDLGVSYNDYGSYIQKFAVDLDQYKAAAQMEEEKEAANSLGNPPIFRVR